MEVPGSPVVLAFLAEQRRSDRAAESPEENEDQANLGEGWQQDGLYAHGVSRNEKDTLCRGKWRESQRPETRLRKELPSKARPPGCR